MEHGIAAHVVVAIPELTVELFSGLSPHDLAICIRVCRHWRQHIEPILWKKFCHGGRHRTELLPETTAALIRNLPYLRTVELTLRDHAVLQQLTRGGTYASRPGDSAADPCAPCTQLRQLRLENSYTPRKNMNHLQPDSINAEDFCLLQSNAILLLNHNRYLTHLTLPFPDVKPDSPILAAISNLRGLQFLAVQSNGSWPIFTLSISLLLRVCLPLPELTELRINTRTFFVDKVDNMGVPDMRTIINEAAIARFSQTPTPGKIKALQLPDRPEGKAHPLALSLLNLDLLDLESFMVPQFAGDSDPNEVEQLIQERCPSLQHLICSTSAGHVDGCRNMRAVIGGCSGLRSFAADVFCDRNYDEKDEYYSSRLIIWDLVLHHQETLEVLVIKNCEQVASRDLQKVLSLSKRLRRFHVSGRFPDLGYFYHPDGGAGYETTDASEGKWVCTNLRELWISLNRYDSVGQDGFYQQIGRLKQLEQLTLDISRRKDSQLIDWEDESCFEINKDTLGTLAGLKNLKILRMASCFCSNMRLPEVELMHEHWPLLNEIIIIGNNVSNLRIEEHWQWLLDRRPYLRFSIIEIDQMTEYIHYH